MKSITLGALLSVIVACSPQPDIANDGAVETPAADRAPTAPAAQAPIVAPPAAVATPALAVEGEGLRLFDPASGRASPLAFGQPQDAVLGILEKTRGPAGKGINQDCGAGPVDYANWPDGLGLAFQEGKFVGWSLDGRAEGALSTATGIGPGSTRAQLEDAYATKVEQSSLGSEFSAGDLFGVLDGPGQSARVTDMWAGVSCVAR